MRLFRAIRGLLVVLATFNIVLPTRTVVAAAQRAQQLNVRKDLVHVALGKNGQMQGQLVDPQGKPLADHPVAIYDARRAQPNPKPIAEGRTDAKGRFTFHELRPSAVIVVADDSVAVCQCWNSNLAPPSAKQDILLVTDGKIERGQSPIGELLFANPIIMALLIIAAIAIPVAIHDAQDDAS